MKILFMWHCHISHGCIENVHVGYELIVGDCFSWSINLVLRPLNLTTLRVSLVDMKIILFEIRLQKIQLWEKWILYFLYLETPKKIRRFDSRYSIFIEFIISKSSTSNCFFFYKTTIVLINFLGNAWHWTTMHTIQYHPHYTCLERINFWQIKKLF